MKNIEKIIISTINEFLNENNADTINIKNLKNKLLALDNWFLNHTYGKNGHEFWDEKSREAQEVRKKLMILTNDPYGESKEEKEKKKIKPQGLDMKYDNPYDVPKEVYRWIYNNTSLLNTNATDAVRWSRIINTKNDNRYSGEITIYRAVDNQYDDIREGDWVSVDEKYAIEHNNRYFNGKGKIIEMVVDGKDVLVSPTGDREEAIYAPMKYSVDIKLQDMKIEKIITSAINEYCKDNNIYLIRIIAKIAATSIADS